MNAGPVAVLCRSCAEQQLLREILFGEVDIDSINISSIIIDNNDKIKYDIIVSSLSALGVLIKRLLGAIRGLLKDYFGTL